MPTLLLLRHAKSSWEDDELDDFERPLNPRGRRAAPAMGELMLEQGLVPNRVLCSPAARTRETWSLVAEALGREAPTKHPDTLYLADAGEILEEIRRHGGDADRLLVVGHNPGMERLALTLPGSYDPDLLGTIATKYPTGALAVFEVEGTWDRIAPERVRLADFVRPKDLPEAEERGL